MHSYPSKAWEFWRGKLFLISLPRWMTFVLEPYTSKYKSFISLSSSISSTSCMWTILHTVPTVSVLSFSTCPTGIALTFLIIPHSFCFAYVCNVSKRFSGFDIFEKTWRIAFFVLQNIVLVSRYFSSPTIYGPSWFARAGVVATKQVRIRTRAKIARTVSLLKSRAFFV